MNGRRTIFSKYTLLFPLILATTISYGGSSKHQFVWDDHSILADDPIIQKIENIPYLLLPYYWKHISPGTKVVFRSLRPISLAISHHLSLAYFSGYHLTKNGYTRYYQGKLEMGQGNHRAARRELKASLKLNPSIAEAWFHMGVIFYSQGKTNPALESFEKSIAINCDYFDAHFQLGNLYLEQKRFDEAMDSFQGALRIKPDHLPSHLHLGIIFFHVFDNEMSVLLHMRNVLKVSPEHLFASQISQAIWSANR